MLYENDMSRFEKFLDYILCTGRTYIVVSCFSKVEKCVRTEAGKGNQKHFLFS